MLWRRIVKQRLWSWTKKAPEWSLEMVCLILYQQGWRITLVGSHENTKLELPRPWEPLDNLKPSQNCEGTRSFNLLSYGNQVDKEGFNFWCKELPYKNKFVVKKPGLVGGLAMMWKEDVSLDVFKYSDNQISAIVTESDGFWWVLTGDRKSVV